MRPTMIIAGAAAAIAGAAAAGTRWARSGSVGGAGDSGEPQPGWASCSAPTAHVYAATFGRGLAGLYTELATDLRTRMDRQGGLDILDIGAGPGGLAVAIARAFPDSAVTALDVNVRMAELATARIAREDLDDRVRVIVGDVTELPVPDQSVDLVTSSFSVHHWPDAAAGFAEVNRVLRPGGRAIIYDVPDWWGRFETRAPRLVQSAEAGGFTGVESSRVRWPGPIEVVHRIDVTG